MSGYSSAVVRPSVWLPSCIFVAFLFPCRPFCLGGHCQATIQPPPSLSWPLSGHHSVADSSLSLSVSVCLRPWLCLRLRCRLCTAVVRRCFFLAACPSINLALFCRRLRGFLLSLFLIVLLSCRLTSCLLFDQRFGRGFPGLRPIRPLQLLSGRLHLPRCPVRSSLFWRRSATTTALRSLSGLVQPLRFLLPLFGCFRPFRLLFPESGPSGHVCPVHLQTSLSPALSALFGQSAVGRPSRGHSVQSSYSCRPLISDGCLLQHTFFFFLHTRC